MKYLFISDCIMSQISAVTPLEETSKYAKIKRYMSPESYDI